MCSLHRVQRLQRKISTLESTAQRLQAMLVYDAQDKLI